uniref:DNA replication fork stabilization factor DONSON n=1 Tax=Lepisosteus oculatus TaxID=7918 RepID=W5MYP3_LEPOC|nr:PREDICTED: protein downstream neighbor of Son [Lepisosteus oculatus]
MSEHAGYSPSFKRPADTLRLRRQRQRSRSEVLTSGGCSSGASPGGALSGIRPFSPGPLLGSAVRTGGQKRRNPFASIENTYNSPKKRAVEDCQGGDGPAGCKPPVEAEGENGPQGLSVLERGLCTRRVLAETHSREPFKVELSLPEDDSLLERELFSKQTARPHIYLDSEVPAVTAAASDTPCTQFPPDWSLKTRLLFTSPRPFAWAENLKAQEEAQGLVQHCRATHANLLSHNQELQNSPDLRCAFQQSLVYWQHPSLPWLPLFPRIGAERKLSGKSAPWAQDEALQQSLMSEWCVSVTSLYSLLRARLCPYFYLCSYQFTVLFRAAGLSGTRSITALLSPTTLGLREAMRSEGIEFMLPLVEEKRKCRGPGSTGQEAEPEPDGSGAEPGEEEHSAGAPEDSGEDVDEDDDGVFSWLEEMGVQDKIKKPNSAFIKLRKEHSEARLDHKPESVVLVEGPSTFILLNFLINCKSLTAVAGPQAGLPPTLLAPVAFRGATLRTLKARSVNVKTQVRNGFQDLHSLEITGPVMPHALHALTLLLRQTQQGSFSAGLYTHEPTAVLNTAPCPLGEPMQDGVAQGLEGCGLHPDTVQQLTGPATLGKNALRQLQMKDYRYMWKS